MDEFFRGVQNDNPARTYPSVRDKGMTASQLRKLRDAVVLLKGACDPAAGENAFEIGRQVA